MCAVASPIGVAISKALDPLHKGLGADAMLDQVGDRHDLQTMLARKRDQLRQPLHRSVVVHDLRQHANLRHPGEPAKIGRGFRVAGADQNSAGLADQRKDMSRAEEIRADAIVVGECVQRVGALVGGDAGREPDAVIDRNGEGGSLRVAVRRHHRARGSAGRRGPARSARR